MPQSLFQTLGHPHLPRLSLALWAALSCMPCLAFSPAEPVRPATPPAGELLHTPDVQLRWAPQEPGRSDIGPAQVDATANSALGRWQSSLRLDPAQSRPQRVETSVTTPGHGDQPALQLGDTRSTAISWDAPVRFGGVRLGTPGRPGWVLEAGRLRTEDARGAPAYGDAYTAATWQTGQPGSVRLAARAEAAGERSQGGVELQAPAPGGTTLRSAVAHADDGSARWLLGADQAERGGSGWSLRAEHSTGAWTALQGETAPQAAAQADARWPLSPSTRLELGLNTARRLDQPRASGVRLGVRTRLAGRSSLRWDLAHSEGAQPGWQARLSLQVPLER